MTIEKSLRLPERFDFDYHKSFTTQYEAILADKLITNIVLDFTDVQYLDSSALGMMVLLQKKAKGQQVSISIQGAKGSAHEILHIANFDRLFNIT